MSRTITQSPSQGPGPDSRAESPQPGSTPPPPPKVPSAEDVRLWCAVAHFAGLLCLSFPGGGVLGPFIIWMVKKDEIPDVVEHGKRAINFHITVLLAGLALFAATFVTFGFGACITVPMLIALVVFQVVMTVIAGIQAYNGALPTYPLSFKFI